jgi:hypothetical protein
MIITRKQLVAHTVGRTNATIKEYGGEYDKIKSAYEDMRRKFFSSDDKNTDENKKIIHEWRGKSIALTLKIKVLLEEIHNRGYEKRLINNDIHVIFIKSQILNARLYDALYDYADVKNDLKVFGPDAITALLALEYLEQVWKGKINIKIDLSLLMELREAQEIVLDYESHLDDEDDEKKQRSITLFYTKSRGGLM